MLAPSSPKDELEKARAIAIDWGEQITRGFEQAGNIYALREMIIEQTNGLLGVRFIRAKQDGSGNRIPETALETTEKDASVSTEIADIDDQHWYSREKLSPAITVFENQNSNDGHNMSVVDALRETGMSDEVIELLLFTRQRPIAALPQIKMDPVAIVEFLNEHKITCRSPHYLHTKADPDPYKNPPFVRDRDE